MIRRRDGTRREAVLGVRARLLGLALIPSVGLSTIAIDVVAQHRWLAEEAHDVAETVDVAALALDGFVAASREYRIAETVVQAGRFGLSPEEAGQLLGIDIDRELLAVRTRVDANPVLGQIMEATGIGRTLRAERWGLGDGELAGDLPAHRKLLAHARGAWMREIRRLDDAELGPELRAELRQHLHLLRSSARLYELANDELVVAAQLVVPEIAGGTADGDDLALASARYLAAMEHVVEDADEHVPVAVGRVRRHADRFADAAAAAGFGDGAAVDAAALADVFRIGLERDLHLQSLAAAAADDARAHAVVIGDQASAQYRETLVVIVALLAATFGVALVVARSISAPLRRLARRAAEVSDGELDGPSPRRRGPRETVVLARALDDAVGNLRAVERQMAALAAGDVAAAAGTTPGKLGTLVGRSVDGLARSIAERDRLQQRLAHEAAHDSLTGLANRRTAVAGLEGMLGSGSRVGVCFIDLDGFKAVNDEQGHAMGDVVLGIVAERLVRAAPPGAIVARLGGDEFLVAGQVSGEAEALAAAEKLLQRLTDRVVVHGLLQRVGASAGIVVSRPGDDADALLRSADTALYEAKRAGRGIATVLDGDLRAQLEAAHQLEADLRIAISAGQLQLHYQPVMTVDGRLHGVEALVRWPRDDGSLVAPEAFIPAAERAGLIVELDRWVLERALRQLATWRQDGRHRLRMSVNVSARTLLSPHLLRDVGDALERTGEPGSGLVLEVTETALVHDLDTAAARIAALAELGVRVSVDDFGIGYTSISQLRRLPVAEVKVDRSFVHAMVGDERDRTLVELVVRIGRVLGLDVVAEGVETVEQLDLVRRLGCRFAQGHLLGRPVPAELVPRLGAPASCLPAPAP